MIHTGRLMTVSLMGWCCLVLWKQYPETGCSSSVWSVAEAHSLRLCVRQTTGRR